ncbi:hypothetical protein Ancab_027001 [Ancistrocladus abbreviatus]
MWSKAAENVVEDNGARIQWRRHRAMQAKATFPQDKVKVSKDSKDASLSFIVRFDRMDFEHPEHCRIDLAGFEHPEHRLSITYNTSENGANTNIASNSASQNSLCSCASWRAPPLLQ